ncbi:MAG: hypothetical protein ACREP9_23615 [Candidatus Dormibacteraceae bacterium]
MDDLIMPEDRARQQLVTPSNEILLPPAELTVPVERHFPIRCMDWNRLRRKIASLPDPLAPLASVGWAFVGIAAAAAIAYFPWTAMDSGLPIKIQQRYAYISPVLASMAIGSIMFALYAFFEDKKTAKMRKSSVNEVLADMDDIHKLDETSTNKGAGMS